jgi:hypothetical protein
MANARDDLLAVPQGQSIAIVGTPGFLRIDLPLLNSSGSPVVVRDTDVRAMMTSKEGRAPLGISASLTAVVQAGQVGRGTLQLQIDAHTPPGEYAGEVEISGSMRQLALTIVEQVRLSIDPRPIVLDGSPGSTGQKTVIFRNLGNVPLHIRDPGSVTVGEELPFASTATAEVTAVRPANEAVTRLLGKLFERRQAHLLKEVGVMTTRLLKGAFTIEPGAMVSALVECVLPDNLLSDRRYRAYAPIYNADLEFLIVPAAITGKQRKASAARRSSARKRENLAQLKRSAS